MQGQNVTKIVKVKTGAKLEKLSSYSRLVMVDRWIHVSNTAGRNPATQDIPEGLEAQTHQVFDNIETALKAVGSSLADVIATRVYIQTPGDTHAVMAIFGDRFRSVDPTTTVTSPPLASDIYKVEIEVTAYLGAGSADVTLIDTSA